MNTEHLTWASGDSSSKAKAFSDYQETIQSFGGIYKHSAGYQTFDGIETNRSVRPEYTRMDYDAFRENAALPTNKRQAIKLSMEAYRKVGLIKNIIDLMSDFTCQGISVIHRNTSSERIYQQWAKKVRFRERSERFANIFYRAGNVVCYRSYADVTPSLKEYMKTIANDISFTPQKITPNRIPMAYTFFNPLSLNVKEDGNLYLSIANKAQFLDYGTYNHSFNIHNVPKSVFEKLPKQLREQLNKDKKEILLENDRLRLFFYKKDDWDQWADPMIAAILDDVNLLEKMKLADISALDGAISNIRLWRLGDLEHQILPNKEGIDRLRQILASNQGGGTMELVWGPELDFKESSTDVHKFLGSEKYTSVLNAIYAGLGVPPTLTGLANSGGGFTNNFISLKTMVERLQYCRDALVEFWSVELEILQKALGLRYPAEIRFDHMSLSDEAAEKQLLVQLADRDIISYETLLERFKENPSIEERRVRKEFEERTGESMPLKAGPFHNGDFSQDMQKMDKQLKHNKEVQQLRMKESKNKDNSKPNGRPPNTKDSAPRKQRKDTPRSKPGVAELIFWSNSTIGVVSEKLNKAFLETCGKSNLRQLTKSQFKDLERLKLDVFTNLEPLEDVKDDDIFFILQSGYRTPVELLEILESKNVTIENTPIDEYRSLAISLYVESLCVQ